MADNGEIVPTENNVESPTQDTVSPSKRKRLSQKEKVVAESEAILKEMGFEDKDTPGRRSTRAAARGTVYSPPPKKEKKERKSTTPGGSGRRGRPKKASETEAHEDVDEMEAKENHKDDEESHVEEDDENDASLQINNHPLEAEEPEPAKEDSKEMEVEPEVNNVQERTNGEEVEKPLMEVAPAAPAE